MRRYILLLISMITVGLAYSQNCTPDQNITEPGFHPKTIEAAMVDSTYKQVIQVRVFKDTNVIFNNMEVYATIDSIKVVNVDGLPSGFYYTCSTPNCNYVPSETGCATLEGTASAGQVGDYGLELAIEVYAKLYGTISIMQPDTIRQFTMVVTDLSSAPTLEYSGNLLYPNPSQNGNLTLSSNIAQTISNILCFNAKGQQVDYKMENGKLSLDANKPGLYTILLQSTTGKTYTQRVVVGLE